MVDGKTKPSRVVGSLSFQRPTAPLDTGSCSDLRVIEGTKCAMPFVVKYCCPAEIPQDDAAFHSKISTIIDDVFETVEQTFSPYVSGSEISRFNKAEAGKDFRMSRAMKEVIHAANDLVLKTRHLFDPAIGPVFDHYVSTACGRASAPVLSGSKEPVSRQMALEMKAVSLWKSLVYRGFGKGESGAGGRLSKALEELKEFSSWAAFEISPCGDFLRKSHPRAKLSLNAISKGWAVDELCRRLVEGGLRQFYVDWAGDIKVKGLHPSGRKWRVSVGEPPSIARIEKEVEERTSSKDWDGKSLVRLWPEASMGEEKYLAFLGE